MRHSKNAWNSEGARERLRHHLRGINRLGGGVCDAERKVLQDAIALAGKPGDPCVSRSAFTKFCRAVFGRTPLGRAS